VTRKRIVIPSAIAAVLVVGIALPWALASHTSGKPHRVIVLRLGRPHPAATLTVGQLRTFEPGAVASGDTIACASGKLLAEAQVPARSPKVATGRDAWTKTTHASISITWAGDRVVARCD
jgi:hypothetical protein